MNEKEFGILNKSFFSQKQRIHVSDSKKAPQKKKRLEDVDPDLTTYYLRISSIAGSTKTVNPSLPSLSLITRGKAMSRTFSLISKQGKSFFAFPNKSQDSNLKYVICNGNNSELIKKLMEKRVGWEEIPYIEQSIAHFIWQPISKNLRFDRLLPYLPKQVANHFENHSEITDKKNLYQNLCDLCSRSSFNINDLVPKTFFIELQKKDAKAQIKHFLWYFKNKCKGKAFWIFKPSGWNRGQGIQLFNKLSVFKQIVKEVCESKECENFIIQKYIENPLLINNRKFDIRVWVLVTHEYRCFFCKEGYLRTSSEEFSLDSSLINDRFVHLTNNAVQQKGSKYCKFEDGNQIDLKKLQDFLPGPEVFREIYEKMQDLVKLSLQAVKKKLNPQKRQYCFEVFGYDFLVDSQFKVWLIECNTNPCLELSSKLLEKLIPAMIDQALGLTVDKIFNKDFTENTLWEYLLTI